MELSREDIEVLIEALPLWEDKDSASEFMGAIFEAVLGPKEGPEREAWIAKRDADRAQKQRERSEAKRLRKERSVIIQTKLLQIRDRLDVEKFSASR